MYEPLSWSGACADGKALGEGRLVFRVGASVYEGGMLKGKTHGSGMLEWSDGFRYEGELRDRKLHGRGTLPQANGERYAGAWRDGRPHGRGNYTQADGTTFDGDRRDGCFGECSGRWTSVDKTVAARGLKYGPLRRTRLERMVQVRPLARSPFGGSAPKGRNASCRVPLDGVCPRPRIDLERSPAGIAEP